MSFEPSSFVPAPDIQTSFAPAEQGWDESKREMLPLVSVIVTNYNYGAFLEQAVASVMAQTYPNIECVIIDDCSTDDSHSVIAALKARYPALRSFVNETNRGQSVSSLEGFSRTRGAYVIFLDADDYFLPNCVETHVRAFLSLRIPVGFTSVDMFQVVDERITLTGFHDFANFVMSGAGQAQDIVREFEWDKRPADARPRLKDKLHFVHPKDAGHWPWTPTSGNCFRRDALKLILNNKRLHELRLNTDTYILRGVASLCGSVLIDVPLVVYRIHQNNNFASRASLHHMRGFHFASLKKNSQIATSSIIDHFIDNLADISMQIESEYYLIEALAALGNVFPKVESSRKGVSYLTEVLLKRRQWICDAIGEELYCDILFYGWNLRKRYWAKRFLPLVSWAIDRGFIFSPEPSHDSVRPGLIKSAALRAKA